MFELRRTVPMPEYNGTGYFYVHRETDMEVFHIKNDEKELSCSFMFCTPSEDSMGVAHILEHTVLCGSRKYPVKDPFSQALLTSPNTFLNAITMSDKTLFPFSSPMKKDFDILFSIYADAVFAPLLRRESFMQEGVHRTAKGFDGVVFNEMSGARDGMDDVMGFSIISSNFKDTPYMYDSGGAPVEMVDLTYEQYLERYRKWYDPSNCRLFLYGDLEAREYLDQLEEEYLKGRQKGNKIILKSEDYLNKEVKSFYEKRFCSTKDANAVVVSWFADVPNDSYHCMAFSLLVNILLGNPGAPLYSAITASELGEDLNNLSGIDCNIPSILFSVGFSGARKNSEKQIEDFFLSQLGRIADAGLEEDLVQSVLKRYEFTLREIPSSGSPYGFNVGFRAARGWMIGRDPEESLGLLRQFEKIRKQCAEGPFFENMIRRYLLDNPRRIVLTVECDPDYEKNHSLALRKKMESHPMTKEDRKNLAGLRRFVETPDSPEVLASIPRISRDDFVLERKKKTLITEEYCGRPVYLLPVFTRSICYINLAFDIRNLNESERMLLPFLLNFMRMTGTSKLDYPSFCIRMNSVTGGYTLFQYSGNSTKTGRPVSAVGVRARCLQEDLPQCLDFIRDALLDSNLYDTDRMQATLSENLSYYETSFMDDANGFASMRAASRISNAAYENELQGGISNWFYLRQLKQTFFTGEKDPKRLSGLLTKLRDKIFTRTGLTAQLSCEGKDIETSRQMLCAFIDNFREGKFVRTSNFYSRHRNAMALESGTTKELFLVSNGPAFNAVSFVFRPRTERELVAAKVFFNIRSNGLWDEIRSRNGAYGVDCHCDIADRVAVCSTYRDPQTARSYEAFRKVLESDMDPVSLEYSVVTCLGRRLRPVSPRQKSYDSLIQCLLGEDEQVSDRRMEILLSLTMKDMVNIRKKLLGSMDSRLCCVTIAGREKADSPFFKDAVVTELPI